MLLFWENRKSFVQFANSLFFPLHAKLNLGGGPDFVEWGWINLDGAPGRYNPRPFAFDNMVRLPFRTRRFRKVYSSHFLEHLLEDAVRKTLLETHRVMHPGGELVVKIPDYDATLSAWRRQDADFFSDDKWNFSAVTHTWSRRGIEDNLTNRALMIFCGYWNREYGDPFAGDIRDNELAFHGPPKVADDEARTLLASGQPSKIARALHCQARAEDPAARFNHQSAWSTAEFTELLENCGFEPIAADRAVICERQRDIAGIGSMFDVSAYFWAKSRN